MRLKYYLRGLGIGIMITTLILAISFAGELAGGAAKISDEEIMRRAKELGMVMPEELVETEQKQEASYYLKIEADDVSRTVCRRLEESGIIENAEDLRTYLFENGDTSEIMAGEYEIPYGLTMEEVAQILQAGPQQ